jgi:hypothetical protein
MNAAKAKPERKKADISGTPDDGVVLGLPDREGEPPIANNAEIQKSLASNAGDKNAKRSETNGAEVDLKIELSDADFSQDPNLNHLKEWATNKRETFPGGKELPQLDDSDDEFEDETQYEVAARDRAKLNYIYKKTYALVNHPLYNFIVFVLILFNTIVLASDDYPQSL